jgi:HD-like signal output (HDOD) protein/ActR/RegA family two-component response regulator
MTASRSTTSPHHPADAGGGTPRVLFVDDDAVALTGTASSPAGDPAGWETRFAPGGEAARALIASERFDVVVCDLSTPGVDGVAVLEYAREHQPDAARILLADDAEPAAALEAARVAHRFLARPWRGGELRTTIERSFRLHALLRAESWRRTAGGVASLPSCPRLYVELTGLIAEPDSTAADAALLVERDVAMSAKLLQLVNSAFFGLNRRVSKIQEAVHYLGLDTLRALVLQAGAFEAFAPARPVEGFDIAALQTRSHLAARIARRIAPPSGRDDAFTASMLHGVGLLVLAQRHPDDLAAAIAEARSSATALHLVEYARHGSSHAEVGAYVLGLWGLPERVVEGVAHQHRIDRLAGPAFDAAVVVHVATALAAERVPGAVAAASGAIDEATLAGAGVLDRVANWRALAVAEAART